MKTLLLLLLALATPAFAQVTPATPGGFTTRAAGAGASVGVAGTTTAGKPKPLGAGDKKFIKDSLEGMYFVMELAGKAKTGAKIEGTKTEAHALKADLDKVWAEVAGLAGNNNEKIPTELTGSDKSKAEKLGKAGDKFDKEFFKIVNREVEKLAKTFESSAKSAQLPEVKTIAGNWEPTLKGHVAKLDQAEKEAAKGK